MLYRRENITNSGKQRKNFFGNKNVRDVTDNKKFWETVIALFMGKIETYSKITFNEKKKKEKKISA